MIDLSENIAGPLACMIFGDMGADVIKVERPGPGEATRGLPPRWGQESSVFLTVNRNKRSIALDVRSIDGREALLKLAETADVIVSSFRPNVATRLGLDFEAFQERNPRIVHCGISAFGKGPIGRDLPGYDALIQAFVGIMAMTGEAEGAPVRAAPSVVDISTGLWAALSILSALRSRGDAGPAQDLDITLVDSGLFLLCHQLMGFLGAGVLPSRIGSAAPSAAPYQMFDTADVPILIATSTDRSYVALCTTLGLPELATDSRFARMDGRVSRRAELTRLLQPRLTSQASAHWLTRLAESGVPVAPVQTLADAMSHPVVVERNLVGPAEPGRIDGLKQVYLPMDTFREGARRQPPAAGEHTAEVLLEIGLDPDNVAQFVASAAAAEEGELR